MSNCCNRAAQSLGVPEPALLYQIWPKLYLSDTSILGGGKIVCKNNKLRLQAMCVLGVNQVSTSLIIDALYGNFHVF